MDKLPLTADKHTGKEAYTWATCNKVSYALAVMLALAVSSISWPGFMTFDSVLALQQARQGITQGGYPPMVSYVWWLTDIVVPGQGGMFLLQNLLVFLGVTKFGLAVRAPQWLLALVLFLIAVAPATLGPMLVVWKDIAFGGWLALGAGFTIGYWREGRTRDLVLALVVLSIGAAYRLNSLPALTPLLLLLSWRALTPNVISLVRRALAAVAAAALVSIAMFIWVISLSSWRLPDFMQITPPSGHHGWVMASDLIGMDLCSNSSVLPSAFYPEGLDRAILPQIYHPEHVQLSFYGWQGDPNLRDAAFDEIDAEELQRIWTAAVLSHPLCFLGHRANIAVYLLGLNDGQVFYVTDPNVFQNDMGLEVHHTKLTDFGVTWVLTHADSPLARVWVFMLAASLALAWNCWRRRWEPVAPALFLSGTAYLAVGVLLLPAADLRYQFWVVLAMLMTVLAAAGQPSRSLPVRATPKSE